MIIKWSNTIAGKEGQNGQFVMVEAFLPLLPLLQKFPQLQKKRQFPHFPPKGFFSGINFHIRIYSQKL
jgi:hypothetical protein